MTDRFPTVPIKRAAEVTLGKMIQPVASGEHDVLAPYLRAAHIQPSGRIADLEQQPMWFSPSELRALQLCAQDVVIVEGGAGYGRSALLESDLEGWGFQNSIVRLRTHSERSLGAFVHYSLQAALDDGRIAAACNQATFAHFTAEKVAAFEIPLPPLAVQKAIVAFLDRETATIDEFIADQEELIALLSERRAATISHAVTKGLDPSVPMKDSGVEWLGHVPKNWSVTRVSRFFDVTLGKMLDAGKVDRPGSVVLPYIRAANIQESGLDTTSINEMPFTANEARHLDIRRDDLLVVEGGAVGANVHMDSALPGWSFQKTVNRVRPRSNEALSRFLGYALDALRWNGVIEMLANRSTIAHLTAEKLERLVIGFPPLREQRAIADFLNRETAELDAAIADAREAITLSRERRAALISAAVTGKIDVRGLA